MTPGGDDSAFDGLAGLSIQQDERLVHEWSCLEIKQTSRITDRVGLRFDGEFLSSSGLSMDTERDNKFGPFGTTPFCPRKIKGCHNEPSLLRARRTRTHR
jgi:hypothetical protein